MKRKQEDLIRYLYEHEEKLTSETLSKALSLSIRTIKSYIAELNLSYPGLILSSNRGYTIHKQKHLSCFNTRMISHRTMKAAVFT
mgnify:CR=1 FL=1